MDKKVRFALIAIGISLSGLVIAKLSGVSATKNCYNDSCMPQSVTWYIPGVLLNGMLYLLIFAGIVALLSFVIMKLLHKK